MTDLTIIINNTEKILNETFNYSGVSEAIDEPNVFTFVITLVLIFTFSLIFNILSIASIITARAFTTINLLIINLALADILYTLGIPFFIIQLFNYNLPFGALGCKLFLFTEFLGIIVGIFTIAALSVERFLDVTDKKRRLESISNKFKVFIVIIYCVIIWVLATCFTLPIVFSIKLVKFGEMSSCQSDWHDSTLRMFFIVKFLVIFVIPYSIIIVSSVKLLVFLNEWKKRFNKSAVRQHEGFASVVLLKNMKNNKKKAQMEITTSALVEKSVVNNQSVVETNLNRKSFKNSEKNISSQNSDFSKSTPSIYLNINEMDKKHSMISNTETSYFERIKTRQIITSPKVKPIKIFSNFKKYVVKTKKSRTSENSLRFINAVRRKASRLVLVIILLFLIQWSPFWIFQIIVLFSTANIKYIQIINMIVSTLTYSNTVANPALYMLLTYNFKEYCRKTCLKISKFCKRGN